MFEELLTAIVPGTRFSSSEHVYTTTDILMLVDKASVPAGGPFIILPLVDKAFVPSGGLFIFCLILTIQSVILTADVLFLFSIIVFAKVRF